jgi:hypothetical protein
MDFLLEGEKKTKYVMWQATTNWWYINYRITTLRVCIRFNVRPLSFEGLSQINRFYFCLSDCGSTERNLNPITFETLTRADFSLITHYSKVVAEN